MRLRNTMMTVVLLCIATVTGACQLQKWGDPVPTGPAVNAFTGNSGTVGILSLVTGTWTGSETASVGLSGPLSVTFTQVPTPDANVAGNVAVTLSTGTFHGTFSGTINSLNIVATDGPTGACNYHAIGALNEAGTQITGTYTGSGDGPNCPNKAGTFVLNGQSAKCVTQLWQMNQGNDNARENACTNRGGQWLNDLDNFHDACRFSPNPPGNPGEDMTLLQTTQIICPVTPQ